MNVLLSKIRHRNLEALYALLFLSCCFCFFISLARLMVYDQPIFFLFMNKNLFLAFIPFAISGYLLLYPEAQNRKLTLAGLTIIWLLFFPNAPYMVTDLFHLKPRDHSSLWLDLGILFAFAWTGLMLGFVSLMDMEKIARKYWNNWQTTILVIAYLFLTGYGIYLGRFIRLNSWDIVYRPQILVAEVLEPIFFPMLEPRAWAMTIVYGCLLNLMYFTVKFIRR